MKLRISKNIDDSFSNIIEIGQGLVMLIVIIFASIGTSAIAYSFWQSTLGHLGFRPDQNTFAVVGAIGLCAMQLRDRK